MRNGDEEARSGAGRGGVEAGGQTQEHEREGGRGGEGGEGVGGGQGQGHG